MKTSELIKLLKSAGCDVVRHGHRHDLWYSPITKKQFPVGRHPNQDVAKGTALAILKTAGIPLDS